MELIFHAIAEDRPGARTQARFEHAWPAYRAWYLRELKRVGARLHGASDPAFRTICVMR